jgi:hypothetical protein
MHVPHALHYAMYRVSRCIRTRMLMHMSVF